MKVKTSITLSKEVLDQVDDVAGSTGNRSAFIEAAIKAYLVQTEKTKRDQRDLAIIKRYARSLNREAQDALSYQAEL